MAAIASTTMGAAPAAPPRLEPLAEVLSPSQVRCFMDCPARWQYKYVLHLPEPKNSNLALGAAVHQVFAVNWSQKITTRKDLPVSYLVALFDAAWSQAAKETEFRDEENPKAIGASGANLVAKYMAEAEPIQPVAVELPLKGTIAGVKVHAKLDVMDEQGRIIEVKTAARKPNGIPMDHAFQLATYAQLEPGATAIRVDTLVKTQNPQLVQITRPISDQDRMATERIYPLAQEAMRSGVYMPNRTSMLCSRRNCACWRECERDFGGIVEES